eukprot:UN10880
MDGLKISNTGGDIDGNTDDIDIDGEMEMDDVINGSDVDTGADVDGEINMEEDSNENMETDQIILAIGSLI